MSEFEKEIRELYADLYHDEPKVGDWVIVKHAYNETIITGEVRALKHTKPNRGFHPDADFEFVVWSHFKIKIAAVKGWLDPDQWDIISTMTDFENKKLDKKGRGQN